MYAIKFSYTGLVCKLFRGLKPKLIFDDNKRNVIAGKVTGTNLLVQFHQVQKIASYFESFYYKLIFYYYKYHSL